MRIWTAGLVALVACVGTSKNPGSLPTGTLTTPPLSTGTPAGTPGGAAPGARGLPEGLLVSFEGDCPDGWSEWAPAIGRALVAAANGTEVGYVSGLALDGIAPAPHSHEVIGDLPISGAGISGLSSCCNNSPGASGSYGISADTDPGEAGIPTIARRICRNDVASDADLGHSLPSGTAAFVDAPDCPAGMIRLANSGGYLVVGTDDPTAVGQAIGTPLALAEDRQHSHLATASVDVPISELAASSGGNNDTAHSGLHQAQIPTGPASSGLPTVSALLCTVFQETPSEGGPDVEVPAGGAIWSQVDCPAGWAPDNALIGRIAVGAPPGVIPGETSGDPLPAMTLPRHAHVGATAIALPTRQVALVSGCCNNDNGGNGTMDVLLETDEVELDLPLLHLRACAR